MGVTRLTPLSVTHASYRMTFAGGGRSCIGFKFSQLEMSERNIVFLSVNSPLMQWILDRGHPLYPDQTLSVFSAQAKDLLANDSDRLADY